MTWQHHKPGTLKHVLGKNGGTGSNHQLSHIKSRCRSLLCHRLYIKRHQVHGLGLVAALNGCRKSSVSGLRSTHTNTNQEQQCTCLPRKLSLFQFPQWKFRAPLAPLSSRAHRNALCRNDFRNNRDSVSGLCLLHFRKPGLPKYGSRKKNLPIGRKSFQVKKKNLPIRAKRGSWIGTMENSVGSIRRRRSRKF
jgi:hypothetical protein